GDLLAVLAPDVHRAALARAGEFDDLTVLALDGDALPGLVDLDTGLLQRLLRGELDASAAAGERERGREDCGKKPAVHVPLRVEGRSGSAREARSPSCSGFESAAHRHPER